MIVDVAGVMELVDIADLKSAALFGRAGSNPALGTMLFFVFCWGQAPTLLVRTLKGAATKKRSETNIHPHPFDFTQGRLFVPLRTSFILYHRGGGNKQEIASEVKMKENSQ